MTAADLPPLMPGGESTSAQLHRVERERDDAVRRAADLEQVREELTRVRTLAGGYLDDIQQLESGQDAVIDALRLDRDRARAERDQLSNAVAGWVARFHAAYEALYIEEFDGDSCPDLEATIEYALGAYRRVCASEAAAADQIDSLRAELADADKIAAELRLVTRERDSLARRCAVRFQEAQAVKAELASALIELERLRAQLTKRQGETT